MFLLSPRPCLRPASTARALLSLGPSAGIHVWAGRVCRPASSRPGPRPRSWAPTRPASSAPGPSSRRLLVSRLPRARTSPHLQTWARHLAGLRCRATGRAHCRPSRLPSLHFFPHVLFLSPSRGALQSPSLSLFSSSQSSQAPPASLPPPRLSSLSQQLPWPPFPPFLSSPPHLCAFALLLSSLAATFSSYLRFSLLFCVQDVSFFPR